VGTPRDTNSTIALQRREAVFCGVLAEMLQAGQVRSCSELDNCWGSVIVSFCCEKLVAEAGDRSGTQRKGNVLHW
jgi:hypothetical protein